ncbi:sensor histidine kinase [Streptomyces sp. NPDC005336]|uniref:sensor histidine kinase n=1 Tax=Streptomyces sp. NPDC005336 TaxID=3157035 RepID=UPI0033A0308F
MTIGTHADQSVEDGRKDQLHTLEHQGLLYHGERELLAAALPHLRAGVDAGDATFAVAGKTETEALRDSLGRDAAAVQFMDPSELYKNPVRAMAAFTAVARTLGPRPAWVLVADDWSNKPDVKEWMRYDSIVNLAFASRDFRGFCCYNAENLTPEAIAMVRRTHPKMVESGSLRDNPDYMDPQSFVADLDRQPLPPSPHSAVSMQIRPTDLHTVRAFVTEQAKRCGVAGDALHNLLVAVTEVATNAIRHGGAPVTLRAWPDDGLICEITDSGHWQPEELLTWTPPESALEAGFGLWGVGMLCDTVRVRTGSKGTTVRLRTCA